MPGKKRSMYTFWQNKLGQIVVYHKGYQNMYKYQNRVFFFEKLTFLSRVPLIKIKKVPVISGEGWHPDILRSG